MAGIVRRVLLPGSVAATLSALPTIALAHVGIGETSGFAPGFGHPIGGIDHILAMVMVGLFAWQLGGRALWLVPASFVLLMASGGFLGAAGLDLPFVEVGIASSVVVLGAMLAFNLEPPVAAAMALVGLFAFFHGHAHGAEMPESAGGLAYAAGFMLATALLHGFGILTGFLVGKAGERYGHFIVRTAGAGAALAGLGLLAGHV